MTSLQELMARMSAENSAATNIPATIAPSPAPSIQSSLSNIPINSLCDQVKRHIADLQAELLSSHPKIPTLLSVIRKRLEEDPEIVTLLAEEEINICIQAMMKQTNTLLVKEVMEKASKKKLKDIGEDDL